MSGGNKACKQKTKVATIRQKSRDGFRGGSPVITCGVKIDYFRGGLPPDARQESLREETALPLALIGRGGWVGFSILDPYMRGFSRAPGLISDLMNGLRDGLPTKMASLGPIWG